MMNNSMILVPFTVILDIERTRILAILTTVNNIWNTKVR